MVQLGEYLNVPIQPTRMDGRGLADLRPVKVRRNISMHAEGSALIEIGNTQVMCTATVEDTLPGFLRNKGTGWLTAEYSMLPRSANTRMQRESHTGKPKGRTQEIQRLIGRSLRAVVDLTVYGERQIILDCDVLQADGGTRTASITGAWIALRDAVTWMQQNKLTRRDPIIEQVAAISVGIVDGRPMLDLCYEEDSTADVDMNVVMTKSGKIVEIQGTAEAEPFTEEQMGQMMGLARTGIQELVRIQSEAIAQTG
jgi:ribonuclease PH